MRTLRLSGEFWDASRPGDVVRGQLILDDGRVRFVMDPGERLVSQRDDRGLVEPEPKKITIGDSDLAERVYPWEPAVDLSQAPCKSPLILGNVGDQEVSLFNASWHRLPKWINSDRPTEVIVEKVVLGAHLSADAEVLGLSASVDGLTSWVESCNPAPGRLSDGDTRGSTDVDGVSFRFRRTASDESVSAGAAQASDALWLEYSEPTPWSVQQIIPWVGAVQDIVELVSGEDCPVVSVRIRVLVEGETRQCEVFFSTSDELDLSVDKKQLRHPFLSFEDPESLYEFVGRWLSLYPEFSSGCGALLAYQRRSDCFVEQRVAAAAKAAEEAVKVMGGPSRQVSKSEHRDRVDAVRAALDASDVTSSTQSWAVGALKGLNFASFRDQLNFLLRASGPLGALVDSIDPDFVGRLVASRNPSVHAGLPVAGGNGHLVAAALRELITASLFLHCGVRPDELARVKENDAHVRWVLANLYELAAG
ncbi:MAG: hypothetical protein AAF962_08800 [Actinomycetota bacterium]